MTDKNYDIVVLGGAIIGSAIAYFLARELGSGRSICVVERDPTYAQASTSLSLASIRVQFSTPLNIAISRFGYSFLESIGEVLEVDGDRPDAGLKANGYLLMAGESGRALLQKNQIIQQQAGAQVALLEPADIQARYPYINTDEVALAALGLAEEGWFDAYSVMQALRRKASSLGVTYMKDEACGLEMSGARVTAVNLASGERLAAGIVVNATGPRAAKTAAWAGIELPVHPRKRSVFVFDCKERFPDSPLIIDPSGVYVRPEGEHYVCGWSPPEEDDRDCEDFEVEWNLFEEKLWPILAQRVPAFEAIKVTRAWAGHYAMNVIDHNAILGSHPEVSNFYMANGFSGHGVQQSPAVGRGLAELIVGGSYRSLDLSPFGFERFAQGRLIREENVI